MFHHVKDLQFNARVSRPDPRFANLLLEQFGGENGELAAAMQYFTQAFGAKAAARRQDDRSGWVQSEMTDSLFARHLALHNRMPDRVARDDDAAGGKEFLHAVTGDEDAGGLLSQ